MGMMVEVTEMRLGFDSREAVAADRLESVLIIDQDLKMCLTRIE